MFEQADKDIFGRRERITITLNPADDLLLIEDDSAVVIARRRP